LKIVEKNSKSTTVRIVDGTILDDCCVSGEGTAVADDALSGVAAVSRADV